MKRTLQATALATLSRLNYPEHNAPDSTPPESESSPPDRTPLPSTCPLCNGVIYWRPFGSIELRCNSCRPCPTPSAALWYAAEIPGDPLADIYDPDTRADLAWLARRRPAIVSELLTLERRCDALVGVPDGRAFEDACRMLVEAVHRLCRQSRLMQQLPN